VKSPIWAPASMIIGFFFKEIFKKFSGYSLPDRIAAASFISEVFVRVKKADPE